MNTRDMSDGAMTAVYVVRSATGNIFGVHRAEDSAHAVADRLHTEVDLVFWVEKHELV